MPALGQEPQAVKIADNVYALVGNGGTVTPDNRGRVSNAGFIVGPSGVIVIDSGVSYRHGRQLLKAIRSVTDQPVKMVILTHAVREFVFGAAAFEEIGATIAAHRETRELMKARCGQCLKQLNEQLGDEMYGTRLVLPRYLMDGTTSIDSAGTNVEVLYFGWAATPGSVAVFHRSSGTLFAGGLVSAGHVPAIRDCYYEGWQAALKQLTGLPVTRVVPGYGPPSGVESIRATAQYLDALDVRSRELYEESSSLLEAIDQAALAEFASWQAYDPNHRRNALHRRLQLEIEDLGGDPRSTALPENAL
jgi:glyoxylase-like metal-dependent hydrolase (beta-lactamase superfamily II)